MSSPKTFPGIYVFMILLGASATRPSSQVQSPAPPPMYDLGPVTEYEAALPNSNDVLRFRRGERYRIPNSTVPELGEESDQTLITVDAGNLHRDPFPFADSDAVVVGRITKGQAHLSNDKRDIYSEFKVSVQDIIKSPSEPYLRAEDTIDIERPGGAVRLPSGKTLIRCSKDYSMPLIGKRYLLFLKYNLSTEDFRLVTGYQLEGSHVYELDDLQYAEKDRHPNELSHPLRERGEDEEQFLFHVKYAKSLEGSGKSPVPD
jgi:hypothetical protein